MSDDVVNHPQHYTDQVPGIEMSDVAEHFGFCLGNVIKYVWRAGRKHDALEDLRKASWYLDREISRIETQREQLRAELVRGIEAEYISKPSPEDLARGQVLLAALNETVNPGAVTVGIDPQYGSFTVHDPDGSSHPANVPPVERWHE